MFLKVKKKNPQKKIYFSLNIFSDCERTVQRLVSCLVALAFLCREREQDSEIEIHGRPALLPAVTKLLPSSQILNC